MGAKKKIAPDWRGDVKRLESDQIRLHNGLTTAFQLINNLDSRVRLLSEPKPTAEPTGSMGEYLEPEQLPPA